MDKKIVYDVGGYDGTSDNAPYEVRKMDWAVYKNDEPIALFVNVKHAEALLELLDAQLRREHVCTAECLGSDCDK